MLKIRPAYVAGQFYPADSEELREQINQYLQEVDLDLISKKIMRAIIVPHAGYVFSGLVAAYAYKTLIGRRIKRVFLLGNSHRSYFDGLVVDDSDAWETPLGRVMVDKEVGRELASMNKRIFLSNEPHQGDHILEVQLPFLQVALADKFQIVPIVFGNQNPIDYQELGKVLLSVVGEEDLIVASSDLSHYPPASIAEKIDQQTLEHIVARDVVGLEEYIMMVKSQNIPGEETVLCGPEAVKTIMLMAQKQDWIGRILHYAHSGNSPLGDKERVVGYGAIGFYK